MKEFMRQRIVVWSTVALGVVLVLGLAFSRRAALQRAAPSWLNVDQPAPDVAARLDTLNAAESWAANRASHMSACCTDRTAGRRVRRTYPGTLAESDCSIVRASGEFRIGG